MVSRLADGSVQTKIISLPFIADVICDTGFDDGHNYMISQMYKLGYLIKSSDHNLYVIVGKGWIALEVACLGWWHCQIPWLR